MKSLAEQLAEIKARADAATPGPWEWENDDMVARLKNGGWTEIIRTDSCVYPPEENDKPFIAHSRTDIPRLVAALEEAIAQRDLLISYINMPETKHLNDRLAEILGGEK